jgi:hypothetical protein
MNIDSSGQSTDLLFEVVRVLNERNIEYAVIGAMAVSVHGVVRASMDADALVSVEFSELKALADVLTTKNYKAQLRRGDLDDPIPAMLVVSDHHDNRVDLLMGLRGLDAEVYKRTVEIRLPEYSCALHIASKEDVIAMKCFAGGPLDLMDAQRLIAVAGDSLDKLLLYSLVTKFGKDAVASYEGVFGQ